MSSTLDAFRLDGKVAIVTGAGRGIGAEIARTFADAGADVVLAARTKEQLDGVAEDVRGFGRRRGRVADRRQRQRCASTGIVDRTIDELGRLDIVVNNAGGTMPRPFMDTSPGFLERSFHFNVTTAFVLSKAAAPHLLDAGEGAIVNISSAIGRLRDRGFVAYGTAKACAEPHDASDGRRPRAEGARERDRGRFDRDVRARNRPRQMPRYATKWCGARR